MDEATLPNSGESSRSADLSDLAEVCSGMLQGLADRLRLRAQRGRLDARALGEVIALAERFKRAASELAPNQANEELSVAQTASLSQPSAADNEERFRLLVDTVRDYAIFMLDPDGLVTTWNAGAERLKGYCAEEIIGRSFATFYTPEDIATDKPARELKAAVVEGRYEGEGWRVRKDGSRFWANIVLTALRDSSGALRGFAKVTRDVTIRKQMEDELQRTRDSLAATLYSIGDGVIATDENALVTRLNPVAEKLTGWSEREARGKPITTVFHIVNEQSRNLAENPVDRVLREGIVVGLADHTALIAKDGSERPISDSGAPIRGADGGTQGSVLVFRDITEQRRAELALRESEERFRLFVDNVEDHAIFMLDPEGRISTWNAGAARVKGYSADEILGQHLSTFYSAEDVREGKPLRALEIAASTGRFEDEGWRVRKDGSRFWASVVLTALYDDNRHLRGFAKITRDITKRHAAEETSRRLAAESAAREAAEVAQAQLRRHAEEAAFLAESSALLSGDLDYSTTLQKLAQLAVPRLADWCAADVLENNRLESVAVAHVDPHKVELARELRRRYAPNPDAARGAPQVVRTGRSELYAEITDKLLAESARDDIHLGILKELGLCSAMVVPIVARARPLGALTLVSAKSGRRLTASDLGLAEELGRRAGMAIDNARLYRDARDAIRVRDDFLTIVGHELKTPLSALQLQSDGLQRWLATGLPLEPAMIRDRLGRVVKHTRRLGRLINELLDISRITSGRFRLEREEVDLAAIATEVVERLADDAAAQGSTVAVDVRQAVRGQWDRLRLEQVIANLVSNAIKFGDRKPIEVSVHRRDRVALLRVRDHGIGIDERYLEKSFDRFERALEDHDYGGLGLGLWIARQIVRAHDGLIRVESAPNVGSTFTIELPCTTDAK